MGRKKRLLVLLFFCTIVLAVISYQGEVSAGASDKYLKHKGLKSWFKRLSVGWKRTAKRIDKAPKEAQQLDTTTNEAIETGPGHMVNAEPVVLESSILSGEELRQAALQMSRQSSISSNTNHCTCSQSPRCSVTCTSLECHCGRTCTHFVEFSGKYYTSSFVILVSTIVNTYSIGCEEMISACATRAVAAVAAVVAAAAVAVGVAIPVGAAAAGANAATAAREARLISQGIGQFIASGGLIDSQTPVNGLTLPVGLQDWRDDGCGDASVLFSDGICYPVLRRGPCNNPLHWLTVNPTDLSGQCRPRLCGKNRVFVGQDALCHDIEDPLACRGGRRLYYTAFGDPLCDCPVGQFPFPSTQDDCVPLFTRGPCPLGHVVSISRSGALGCTLSECQFGSLNPNLPLVRHSDGFCYALGSRGPCRSRFQFFGYDVFQQRARCSFISSDRSPYFMSSQEDVFLANTFDQLLPSYDDYRINLIAPEFKRRNGTALAEQRQFDVSAGVFQFPAFMVDPLLNPCRTGGRNGNNFKCTNPILPVPRRKRLLQAVRSAFECPSNTPASFLQATGQCGSDPSSASCGPSYQYIESLGQCRSLFGV